MEFVKLMIRRGTIVLSWIGKIMIFAMMFFIAASVFMRYIAQRPLLGSNDIVMAMMVTIIMAGFSYTQSQNGHVAVRLFVDKLSPHTRMIIDFINNILMLAATLLLAWKSLDYALFSFRIMDSSDSIELPFYPFRFMMFVGFLFWALETLLKLLETKSTLLKRDSE